MHNAHVHNIDIYVRMEEEITKFTRKVRKKKKNMLIWNIV